jgi:hypothetical protein
MSFSGSLTVTSLKAVATLLQPIRGIRVSPVFPVTYCNALISGGFPTILNNSTSVT